MAVHQFASSRAETNAVELNLCFGCHGIWFDPQENLKLAPAGVVALFKLLHTHRGAVRTPLATQLDCPRCDAPLAKGFDVVISGRYITYRCTSRHGRFSTFSSFMIEKGFVRQLTQPEINDIAQRVAVIHCNSCGAPVDLRKDHACPHCRSAFSLLDPTAVERALLGYKSAGEKTVRAPTAVIQLDAVAEALMAIERDSARARDAKKKQFASALNTDVTRDIALWDIGIAIIAKMLD